MAITSPERPSRNPHTRGGGTLWKMVLLGFACLIVLPTGAILATVYAPQIKGTADRAMAFVDLARELGGDGSAEQRSASAELNGVHLRMTTGTMSAEEKLYWKSADGNARLRKLEKEATQVNHDKLLGASKRLYGVD